MRFAYADPPYPGTAHLYRDHPDYAGEVDHAALIARLTDEFPDGWALSTASTTLREVLIACPPDVRILSWCLTNPVFRSTVPLVYAWQPTVLYRGRLLGRKGQTTLDYLISKNGDNFIGAKPETYCYWLFRCLGALPGDELCDLFPGSGAVGRAWDKYQRQISLPLGDEREKQTRLSV